MDGQTSGIAMTLDLLQDCLREAQGSMDQDQLETKVLEFFHADDLEGISQLMQNRNMAIEFNKELEQFIARWSTRIR